MSIPSNGSDVPAFNFPTVEMIERIRNIADPVNRNLQITDCYHELSNAFTSRTGIVANWCSFATWASKQAGVTIRGEDLKRRLEEELSNDPEIQGLLSALAQHSLKLAGGTLFKNIRLAALENLVQSVMQKAGDAVSRGNKKVFEEIGMEFARFLAICRKDAVFNENNINDFCKTLRPGSPPDGQEYLDHAFRRYYQSFFEKDPKTRDEIILLANIEIGFHEQTRLQPEITESLNAAAVDPTTVTNYLTGLLVKDKTLLQKITWFFQWITGKTRIFKRTSDQLAERAEKLMRRVITKHLMTLTLPPSDCLHLGDDLIAPYPADLEILQNKGLIDLLKQLKPSADTRDGAGCNDWSDLKQRIHYIANLFRCYHENKHLFDDAFTSEQLAMIKAGGVPIGEL